MESMDLGVSIGISAGFWSNTGHIPGFADVYTLTVSILVVEMSISLIETYASVEEDPSTYWNSDLSNGIEGVMLEVAASFPPEESGVGVDFDQAKCFGKTIESGKFPLKMEIDLDKRSEFQVCGPNTFSFNIENTGNSHSDTYSGLSLYYYENESDWNTGTNRKWIEDWCGDLFQGGRIETMGHGKHFMTQQVYGVGVQAHGDDAYNLGTALLYQDIGGGKWVNKFTADGLDLCVSTNDSGCYANIEIKTFGYNGGEGNDAIYWRGGVEPRRLPTSRNHCGNKSVIVNTGKFCWKERKCEWKYNTGCGSGRKITYNICSGTHQDRVWGINGSWESGCASCGKYLKDRNKISSYSCKHIGHGIDLRYTPKAEYYNKCTSKNVEVHFNTWPGQREEIVYNLDNGASWESGCSHAGNYLMNNFNWIKPGWSCVHCGGHMCLRYYKRDDWYTVSSNQHTHIPPNLAPSPAPTPATAECIAADTGFTQVSKLFGSVVSTAVLPLDQITLGEKIIGLDADKEINDECEVVSITSMGVGEVFGNYTSDHYILPSAGSDELVTHGNTSESRVSPKHQLLTTCPLAVDESGQLASLSLCGIALYEGGPVPWDVYVIVHSTLLKLVQETGITSLDSLRDLSYAQQHLPKLCSSGVKCAERDECDEFEANMLDFVTHELTDDAKDKVWKAFPELGDVGKPGSVSRKMSKSGQVAFQSLE
jgi:hypothetical protein